MPHKGFSNPNNSCAKKKASNVHFWDFVPSSRLTLYRDLNKCEYNYSLICFDE